MTQAFPLLWPEGWPRHKGYRESDIRFRGPTYSSDRVRRGLMDEFRKLGATDVVLSTNIELRRDGSPYANARIPNDPGVAVYFKLNKRPLVMAQDRFTTVVGNIRSLTLNIDGLRQMKRHGGDHMMERAFTGFVAIAPPTWKKPWREVFGVNANWTGSVKELYRRLAMLRHSDQGGNDTLMAELNIAYEEALSELGQ